MRRLLTVLLLALAALALYRRRALDRREQELAIGPYTEDLGRG